ncbi:Ig-like domain-containing protein [Zoogloea sp.]|uniref:Ig-like domain-containing protein n=1 Tax=Zoogloea sp. TaxID=49181 RepID=UPI0035AF8BDC
MALAAALALAGCGGGGGGSSTNCMPYQTSTSCTSGGGTTTTPTQTATQLSLTVDSPAILTNGSATVSVSATLKDDKNAVVPGATVSFRADSGTISAYSAVTDSSGVASITFNSNAEKANRLVTLTASSGSLSQSTVVQVRGTRIGFGGDTTAIVGRVASMTVTLVDGANKAIAYQTVALTSKLGNILPPSVTTDANGQAVISYNPTVAGTDTITASALGATLTQDVVISSVVDFVFTSPSADSSVNVNQCMPVSVALSGQAATGVMFTVSRGQVYANSACSSGSDSQVVPFSGSSATAYILSPNAGAATVYAQLTGSTSVAKTSLSVKFVATVPSTVVVQADPSVITVGGSSSVTAIVRDANSNPVAGRQVVFSAPDGGGTPTPNTAVTNDSGIATATFNADASASGKDSVRVMASVPGATPAVSPAVTTLTVAGSAVSIVIGTDNQVVALDDPPRYRKVYGVMVSDSASGPIKNQTVTISLRGIYFRKGCFLSPNAGTGSTCTYTATSSSSSGTGSTRWVEYYPPTQSICPSEDANNNGVVETGEIGDADGDGLLEPDGVAIVRSPTSSGGLSATVTTDASGVAAFYVEYLREYANWAAVELKATAAVAGKNSVGIRNFWLAVPASELLDKDVSPSFQYSPFGVQSGCSSPY